MLQQAAQRLPEQRDSNIIQRLSTGLQFYSKPTRSLEAEPQDVSSSTLEAQPEKIITTRPRVPESKRLNFEIPSIRSEFASPGDVVVRVQTGAQKGFSLQSKGRQLRPLLYEAWLYVLLVHGSKTHQAFAISISPGHIAFL